MKKIYLFFHRIASISINNAFDNFNTRDKSNHNNVYKTFIYFIRTHKFKVILRKKTGFYYSSY